MKDDNILPVGRERDKFIDRIKREMLEKEYSNFLYKANWITPDYSTNRDTAWELWDELPIKTAYYRFKKDCHVIRINFLSIEEFKEIIGISFADAVSKAWIEWKRLYGKGD